MPMIEGIIFSLSLPFFPPFLPLFILYEMINYFLFKLHSSFFLMFSCVSVFT